MEEELGMRQEREGRIVRLSTLLDEGHGVVLDGALATYLETLGADISSALWSASLLHTNPPLIRQAHTTYFTHSAQIATTASYQACIPSLIAHLSISDDEAAALVRKSVVLAQEARKECTESSPGNAHHGGLRKKTASLLVAGSIGPYGASLADGSEYTGAYTLSTSQFHTFHRARIAALVSAGADVLALETIPSFAETRALAELLATEFPAAEAWFSFTLDPSDATRIADGTPLCDVVALLERSPRVVAVGVNCVAPELALAGLKEMGKHTGKPLVVYANSGELWDARKRDWEGEKAGGEGLRAWVRDVWGAGARVIGGCCRTGPEDIAIIAEELGELRDTA